MLPVLPPIVPMLAKLQVDMPWGDGWLYEPKWDGFRAIVFRDGNELSIASRDKRPLQRYFPELLPVLSAGLPQQCVVDGEIVMTGPKGLDFDKLQLRLHPAESRVQMLSKQMPASFVIFDVLALGEDDLREVPLTARWERLRAVFGELELADIAMTRQPGPRLLLTPQTSDVDVALRWFDDFETVGLDGIIAKRWDLHYVPGERVMVKVKHRRTVDCVVGGYRRDAARGSLGSLLLGLYDAAGTLHYVGHTSSFSAAERERVLERLRPLEGGESFGHGRSPGGQSRWSRGRESEWVSVAPELVCEVSYDFMQGTRFRHAARFQRWREDKKPAECLVDQLGILWPGVPAEWQQWARRTCPQGAMMNERHLAHVGAGLKPARVLDSNVHRLPSGPRAGFKPAPTRGLARLLQGRS